MMSRVSPPLPEGTRVRHRGEQYPEALANGTGNIVKVIRHYPQDDTYEYLVQCDKPTIWSQGETLLERNHMVPVRGVE